MKKSLVIILILVTAHCMGQNFQEYFTVQLPDSIVSSTAEWLDMDNSGLYDVVLFTTAASGKQYIQFILGDTVNIPVLSTKSIALKPYEGFVVHDYDNDNQLDFVMSVTDNGVRKSILLKNDGALNFTQSNLTLPAFSLARFFDLDHDAIPECIVSGADDDGNYFTRTFARAGADWALTSDTLKVRLTAFEAVDFNQDGYEDLFMSGEVKPDSVFSATFERERAWYEVKSKSKVLSVAQTVDADVDGLFDVAALGSVNGIKKYQLFKTGYSIEDRPAANLRSLFLAEIDIDGSPDEHKLVISASDTVNSITYSGGSIETLNHKYLRGQRFGDLEHDGDLDLLQITGETKISVKVFRNKLKHSGPGQPQAIAIPLYDFVFVYWPRVGDDHTPAASITYDVYLDGGTAAQDATFDLMNTKRLAVRHGNNGLNNFRIVRDVDAGAFNYMIQAVDNAYHAGSLCIGSGTSCATINKEVLDVCSDENMKFTASADAIWFSLKDGFLGKSQTLDYTTSSKDTVFYISPGASCATVGLFEVNVNDVPKNLAGTPAYVCAGGSVLLTASTDWTPVTWTSAKKGALSTGSPLSFTTDVDDAVTAEYSNGEGCTIRETFNVTISTPTVVVTPASTRILRGQSVQLTASGAATYSWAPPAGLSADNIANPMASPAADTQYTVTGYDSIGCTGTTMAIVYVESSGFIATLFSPNADGKNDRLKVYGVTNAEPFQLDVFNREGKRVYSTKNVGDATSLGWDGTTNGAEQPNGVYFWKVTGSSNGREILLNGKHEGSVVLLR
jgi:gliding motility-associated-like protein